ncbi:MAG: UDP-N-acetylmuramoyl-L-alanyl-D-glutamate--2,6-diaminopimelate ligase [Propionibacteriaceae bacterium]|nr:UDP-N-acetylmuramoyl-L-alanyl-D-glutamate--2,6-diaminopimelate ligase [Propionibacteriaceae bacterium]
MNSSWVFSELVDGFVAQGNPASTAVTGLCFDSRKAQPGEVFFALPGSSNATLDGHQFVSAAYDAGIRAFVTLEMPPGLEDKPDAVVVTVPDVRVALALAAATWHGHPARELKTVAITGTKGKTTISFMLKSIFEAAGKRVGIIGSNGIFYGDTWLKLLNTTPEPVVLHQQLAAMVAAGVEYLFMETTSQGYMMHRTDGIEFELGLYTNISPDHISATEHRDFDDYFFWKQHIFTQVKEAFVNRDAECYERIVAGVSVPLHTFGTGADCEYRAEDIKTTLDGRRMGVEFECVTSAGSYPVRLGIPGSFNAGNGLAAAGVAHFFGIESRFVQEGLREFSVKGRMEYLDTPSDYTVLIDFAHNLISIESMMATAREYRPNRILSVFGLEGDRAHIRRFDCGRVLGRDADYVILSDASPRRDDPEQILADIATGIEEGGGTGKYEIIRDRHVSIPKILDMAEPGDLVLLVGKGDVPYEEVMGEKIPFDEREVVAEYFADKR